MQGCEGKGHLVKETCRMHPPTCCATKCATLGLLIRMLTHQRQGKPVIYPPDVSVPQLHPISCEVFAFYPSYALYALGAFHVSWMFDVVYVSVLLQVGPHR